MIHQIGGPRGFRGIDTDVQRTAEIPEQDLTSVSENDPLSLKVYDTTNLTTSCPEEPSMAGRLPSSMSINATPSSSSILSA